MLQVMFLLTFFLYLLYIYRRNGQPLAGCPIRVGTSPSVVNLCKDNEKNSDRHHTPCFFIKKFIPKCLRQSLPKVLRPIHHPIQEEHPLRTPKWLKWQAELQPARQNIPCRVSHTVSTRFSIDSASYFFSSPIVILFLLLLFSDDDDLSIHHIHSLRQVTQTVLHTHSGTHKLAI